MRLSETNLAYHAGAVTLAVSAPVFSFLFENRDALRLSLFLHFLVLFFFWAGPTLALSLGELLILRILPQQRHAYRVLVALGCILSISGQVRFAYNISLSGLAEIEKVLLVVAAVGGGVAVVRFFSKALFAFLNAVGGLSIAVLGVYAGFALFFRQPDAGPSREHPALADNRGPVFLIVLDGLSGEALLDDDGGILPRFPNLRSLANSGFRLRNATTNFDHTGRSFPALLSGRNRWRVIGIPTQGTIFDDLNGLYREEIYGVYLGYCDDLPRDGNGSCLDGRLFYDAHPTKILDFILLSYANKVLPQAIMSGLLRDWENLERKRISVYLTGRIIESVRTSDLRSRFYYAHLLSPHYPFVLDRDGAFHPRSTEVDRFSGAAREEDVPIALEYYLREVEWVDAFLGRLIHALKERGAWEEATIVVTSDHGYSWTFGHGSAGTPGGEDWMDDRLARVPFIVKTPRSRPLRPVKDAYQHVDLAPSLLDLLDVPSFQPIAWEGRSIFRPGPTRPPKVITRSGGVWHRDAAGRWSRAPEVFWKGSE